MKKVILIAALAIGATAAQAQTTWAVDNGHSKIGFAVEHLKISETEGFFKTYEGSVVSSKEDFDGATVNFSVDAKTVNTDNEMRDGHLQGEEWFATEKNPKIDFKGATLKKVNGKAYKLAGNLTVKGITKPVSFDVTYLGTVKDPWGNTKAGFKFKGTIKRTDFNVGKPGGTVVGEEVAINGNMELQKK